jgi:hypothetical protein
MKITITETTFTAEGIPDPGIPGISAEDKAKLDFLQAFAFAMSRLSEELGMVAAQPDTRKALEAMRGKA